jgi:hypothetical protein
LKRSPEREGERSGVSSARNRQNWFRNIPSRSSKKSRRRSFSEECSEKKVKHSVSVAAANANRWQLLLLVPVLVLVLMVVQPDDRCNPRRERKVEEPARSATIRPAVLAAMQQCSKKRDALNPPGARQEEAPP